MAVLTQKKTTKNQTNQETTPKKTFPLECIPCPMPGTQLFHVQKVQMH